MECRGRRTLSVSVGTPMKRFSVLVIAIAVASAAQAVPFSAVTSLDTFVNSSAANVNKAYGTNNSITSNSSSSDFYKFAGSDFSGLSNKTITSLTASFFPTVVDPNTTVSFYFSTNSAWQELTVAGAVSGVNQDAGSVTTPYLTFNDAGLTGSANSRFNAGSTLLGSVTYASNAGVLNTTQSVALSLAPSLINAIKTGTSFSIYSVATSGRMTVITKEGTVATGHPAGATAFTLSGQAQPVPEPASIAALGLGAVALLKRRRK